MDEKKKGLVVLRDSEGNGGRKDVEEEEEGNLI